MVPTNGSTSRSMTTCTASSRSIHIPTAVMNSATSRMLVDRWPSPSVYMPPPSRCRRRVRAILHLFGLAIPDRLEGLALARDDDEQQYEQQRAARRIGRQDAAISSGGET